MKKIYLIFGIIIMITAVVVIAKFLPAKQQITANSPIPSSTPLMQDKTSLVPAFVPEGWKTYSNSEWGIAFAYPPDWSFTIGHDFNGPVVSSFSLEYGCVPKNSGKICDYDIFIGRAGTGLRDAAWTHPKYIIGGEVAKTWQADRAGRDDGYEQIIVVRNIQFHIYTPDKTKKISDLILSTVNLSK